MARVEFDRAKFNKIAVSGPGTMDALHDVSKKIVTHAKEVYLSQRRDPTHNTYLNSFEIKKRGRYYFVYNTAHTAFWVEFGSHIRPYGDPDAEVIHVLGYAPLRTAVDICSSYR